ncbi:RNaseH domain-containing protein [Kribbella sancticallisti]|uniref:RNaseH domain-containing protein n=1 Tax=Kribbella sancticallisti TaxID=460087 RepID=UPI003CD07721
MPTGPVPFTRIDTAESRPDTTARTGTGRGRSRSPSHARSRDEIHLTLLTTQLCQPVITWNGRTASPAPLHLADQADLEHPQPSKTGRRPDRAVGARRAPASPGAGCWLSPATDSDVRERVKCSPAALY